MIIVFVGLLVAGALVPTQKKSGGSNSDATPAADEKPPPKPVKLTARAPHDVQTPTALVTGVVSPRGARVSIEDAKRKRRVRVRNGHFRVRVALESGAGFTGVTVTATTADDSTNQILSINRRLTPEQLAEQRRKEAERQAAQRAAAEARKQQQQQDFINSAETIPYNQLIKDPGAYRGKHVVYTGQIFQIQQAGGAGIMLVAVTNEGYDIWDDNVWIDYFGNVQGAEGDQITVYGVIKGSKSYETQAGGQTFVPRIKAVYISEGGVIKSAG